MTTNQTPAPVYKSFTVTENKAVDPFAGIYEAMISTEGVDRQGDIVRASGARVDSYMRNPVVLWAHDYSQLPVGKTLGLEVVPGVGIKARFQFPEWGMSDTADTVRKMWAAGFLNATSIGFQPIQSFSLESKRDSDPWGAQEYVEWELLEFSIVPVPANADALRLALKQLTVDKYGRVLSRANEQRIREASALLEGVLKSLGDNEQPEEEQREAIPDEPTASQPPNTDDLDSDGAEMLADLLDKFLTAIFKED